jgi:hypothetical protein
LAQFRLPFGLLEKIRPTGVPKEFKQRISTPASKAVQALSFQ